MKTRRLLFAGLAAAAAIGALAFNLRHPGQDDPVIASRLRAQEILRQVCPFSHDAEQVRSLGAKLAAHEPARTLIWSGPQLLYASDPTFTVPAPLLTGAQRAEPGWTGWAEVDLPCGLSVQRFHRN